MIDSIQIQLSDFATKAGVPAVAAGTLSSDGKLEFDVAGVRRRGSDQKVGTLDQWHIGSCAKSITAVLYARLVERGDADWHQPVASLFTDLSSEISDRWHDRTVEELFLCQAGMRANPDRSSMPALYADDRPMTERRRDAAIAAMRVDPEPRGRFLYSNLSYIVIGAAIDRTTGMPFEAALDQYVLKPLGITSLGYGPPELVCGHHSRIRLANWLLFRGKAADPHDLHSDNPGVLSSAGTMHLTMTDWAKFLGLFLVDGGEVDGGEIDSGEIDSGGMDGGEIDGGELLQPATIEYLLGNPKAGGSNMTMGWAKVQGLRNASYGMQGSNTLWSAAALLNAQRSKLSFVVCNDGRTRILAETARFAASLL